MSNCTAYGGCNDEYENYVPSEMVGQGPVDSTISYHLYLFELESDFEYEIPLHNLILAVSTELHLDEDVLDFGFEAHRGNLTVHMKYVGELELTSEQVM